MAVICKICGWKSFEADEDPCRFSPTKKHLYMEESPTGYFCQYCGFTSHTCELDDCQHSTEKKHVYIAKKSSSYVCKYCGWEPTYVMGGACNTSPHGHHEFM